MIDSGLRPAAPGDEPALAAIDELVNPSPWSAAQFVPACGDGVSEQAFVAELEQRIAGFVIYSRVLDEACIYNMAVHPANQRAGLGRSLMLAALEAARGQGANLCYLEVRASNHAARGLYRSLGFRDDGVRRNYYPGAVQREDAVLLSIQL